MQNGNSYKFFPVIDRASSFVLLKEQCISIKAMQSCITSQPVKSLLNVVLQEVSLNNGGSDTQSEPECSSKYIEC